MTALVVLDNGTLRLEIAPELGGSILRMDKVDRNEPEPVLKAWQGDRDNPADRAMFVMAPWCNRISGKGLPWKGRTYPLPRLLRAQSMPIHGTVLDASWNILDIGPSYLRVSMTETSVSPFAFEAILDYKLDGPTLTCNLSLRHIGARPAPYGAGFHPWFACDVGDHLCFNATGFALEDSNCLPYQIVDLKDTRVQDFSKPRALPSVSLNGTYAGWNGHARLLRQKGGAVDIQSPPPLTGLHVYSRSSSCGFVCVEPVSHSVDSPHRTLLPDLSLQELHNGETLAIGITITVHS